MRSSYPVINRHPGEGSGITGPKSVVKRKREQEKAETWKVCGAPRFPAANLLWANISLCKGTSGVAPSHSSLHIHQLWQFTYFADLLHLRILRISELVCHGRFYFDRRNE